MATAIVTKHVARLMMTKTGIADAPIGALGPGDARVNKIGIDKTRCAWTGKREPGR
jgi:hypothetical protein